MQSDLASSRVVVLSVPYDSTTEYKSGTREGPRAIIEASQYLETYDIETNNEPVNAGIHTLPELQPLMSGPEFMFERVYHVTKDLLDKGRLLVILGGEHTVTLGAVKALKEKYPELSVLHLDAHTDLRDEYMGTKYSHACVMRRVWEICPVTHAGIRSLSRDEHDFMEQNGIEPFYADSMIGSDYEQRLISRLSPDIYISIDLDVLDPSIMSAVGTPEPGGISWQQLLGLLHAVAKEKRIHGFDLVELCPSQGPEACAFLAAKLAYKLMGYATLTR